MRDGNAEGAARPFDPWTASVEDLLTLPFDFDNERSQLRQSVVARGLLKSRESIEGGTGRDVMDAVAVCARHGLAMPPWLAQCFLRRYREINLLNVASWDDPKAFGVPHPMLWCSVPTAKKLKAARDRDRAADILDYAFKRYRWPRTEAGFKMAARHFKDKMSWTDVRDWLPKTRRNKRGAKSTSSELGDVGINWHDPFKKSRKDDESGHS